MIILRSSFICLFLYLSSPSSILAGSGEVGGVFKELSQWQLEKAEKLAFRLLTEKVITPNILVATAAVQSAQGFHQEAYSLLHLAQTMSPDSEHIALMSAPERSYLDMMNSSRSTSSCKLIF